LQDGQYTAMRTSDEGKDEHLWLGKLQDCKLKVYLFKRSDQSRDAKQRTNCNPVGELAKRTLKVNLSDTSTAPSLSEKTQARSTLGSLGTQTRLKTTKPGSKLRTSRPAWRLRPIVEQSIVTYKQMRSLGVPADDIILCNVWNEINADQRIPGFEHHDAHFSGDIKQLLRGYGKSNPVLCEMVIDSPHDAERVIRALASAFQPSPGMPTLEECCEFSDNMF
jgi:hypothetical protein